MVGYGLSFYVYIIYHNEREQLFAIKKLNHDGYDEQKTGNSLTQKEINNYSTIFHPLLPKFYGKSYPKDHIVIEYINGKTLFSIDDSHLNAFPEMKIKSNNVMIDENNNVVLIDLDRMIKEENILNDKYQTVDFASYFAAPL